LTLYHGVIIGMKAGRDIAPELYILQ